MNTLTRPRPTCTRTRRRKLGKEFASHTAVNHNIGEYVVGDASTNQAEAFFAQLKRSLDGTHHHVSREHLPRYLSEFEFRFSTCHDTDTERMGQLLSQVGGRRLSYRPAV
ncbi:MAG TPA: transposase [Solirubrobacteraceae bacterium]|nr:transposase [Solirubrobacteraceae bacterium]